MRPLVVEENGEPCARPTEGLVVNFDRCGDKHVPPNREEPPLATRIRNCARRMAHYGRSAVDKPDSDLSLSDRRASFYPELLASGRGYAAVWSRRAAAFAEAVSR